MVELRDPESEDRRIAEVVGINGEEALLTVLGDTRGISCRCEVNALGHTAQLAVSDAFLGRVLGPFGNPIDGKGALPDAPMRPVLARPPNAMTRAPIDRIMPTGLRVIDGLLTCGVGQRIGIFGSAGTGKSTLLIELLRHSKADVVVLGLVGERGREVREFVEHVMADNASARATLVVSTSDSPALERLRAAESATTIAEFFRDQGKNVLLIIDSVTRVARAQREIGLAAGEPPTRRGFPPSVFSMLPALVERAGTASVGSITAFYTVLVEGDDDDQDPVADELRGLLDGHIILSRTIAARGQYPAIDVSRSVSRLMNQLVDDEQRTTARDFRAQLEALRDVELLVKVGEYQEGADPLTDQALRNRSKLEAFLYPGSLEPTEFDEMSWMMKEAVL
ncbi:Flagellum-specific ATP synthase FliI [Candidatus Rhodobacter oscarellae]|uniref:Flagellum-specific ATP synthase FliI n=2 Tax=Candidatus Rhodobacter oscarellae TaxID=1675527 RepID=A0A0J9GSB5_9RHOB|nr:Flagellum-specific ATP synthase FliI [Candidatus Rhodobacter lobularis]